VIVVVNCGNSGSYAVVIVVVMMIVVVVMVVVVVPAATLQTLIPRKRSAGVP